VEAAQVLNNVGGSKPLATAAFSRRYGLDPSVRFDPAASPAEKLQKVRELAQELESVFLTVLLGVMRRNAQPGSLVGNSAGEKTFAPFLDAERARAMSDSGGFGVAEALVEQIGRRYAAGVRAVAMAALAAPAGRIVDSEG